MIALLVLFIVCFGFGILLLEVIQSDAGYVLISINGWTFETSFWFAACVLFLLSFLLFLFYRVFKRSYRVVVRGGAWFKGQRYQSIERQYREGLLNFLTGNYKDANKQLSAVSRRNELPVVRVIASAQSLANNGDYAAALEILKAAETKYPEDIDWLYKASIPLLIHSGRIDEADKALEYLKEYSPNDEALPRLEHYKLAQSHQWLDASTFVANKKIHKRLAVDDIELTYASALAQLSKAERIDKDAVSKLWDDIPKAFKSKESILIAYAKLLGLTEQHEILEDLIVATLSKQWITEFVDLYAKLESSDKQRQLKRAERWLSEYPTDEVLLISLGVLAVKNQLWGKAKTYFEHANEVRESPRALYFLGYLSDNLDGPAEESKAYYKRAAELAQLSA